MKTIGAVLFMLALCVDGWGCGGSADAAEDPFQDGWCCDGICGITAQELAELDWQECTCNGIARADGECDVIDQ